MFSGLHKTKPLVCQLAKKIIRLFRRLFFLYLFAYVTYWYPKYCLFFDALFIALMLYAFYPFFLLIIVCLFSFYLWSTYHPDLFLGLPFWPKKTLAELFKNKDRFAPLQEKTFVDNFPSEKSILNNETPRFISKLDEVLECEEDNLLNAAGKNSPEHLINTNNFGSKLDEILESDQDEFLNASGENSPETLININNFGSKLDEILESDQDEFLNVSGEDVAKTFVNTNKLEVDKKYFSELSSPLQNNKAESIIDPVNLIEQSNSVIAETFFTQNPFSTLKNPDFFFSDIILEKTTAWKTKMYSHSEIFKENILSLLFRVPRGKNVKKVSDLPQINFSSQNSVENFANIDFDFLSETFIQAESVSNPDKISKVTVWMEFLSNTHPILAAWESIYQTVLLYSLGFIVFLFFSYIITFFLKTEKLHKFIGKFLCAMVLWITALWLLREFGLKNYYQTMLTPDQFWELICNFFSKWFKK